jgi:hypothetical protein
MENMILVIPENVVGRFRAFQVLFVVVEQQASPGCCVRPFEETQGIERQTVVR